METPNNTQQNPHDITKQAIDLAYGRQEAEPEFHKALGLINGLPREDVLKMAKLAVAQRNNDGIDMMSPEDQARTEFAQNFLLGQLSEIEKDQVLH